LNREIQTLLMSVKLLRSRIRTRGFNSIVSSFTYRLGEYVKNSSPRKLVNLTALRLSRALKLSHCLGMPYRYYIDPLNACVLHCPLCPTGQGTLKRHRGKMKIADFQRIVDEIADYAYCLSSSLNVFDENLAEKTIESGLSQLNISLDGASQETYIKYRVGGDFDKVIANLALLIQKKQEAKSATPFIIVRALITQHNEDEIPLIRKLANRLGADSFTTGPIFINVRRPEDARHWLPSDSRNSAYNYANVEEIGPGDLENTWHCHDLWESCAISWDGGVAPCCWLHDPACDFGNVFNEPLRDIWNNEHYISSRRVFGWAKKRPLRETVCTQCRGHPNYDY